MHFRKDKTRNDSPDALHLFFEDVARLPVVNGKSEYLPLLRRIRRGTMLRKLTAGTHEATFDRISEKLSITVEEFNQQCQTLGKPLLNLEKLATEFELFLDNPQQDMPPALAHCLDRYIRRDENEELNRFEDLGWHCVYLISLLPCHMRSLPRPQTFSQELELFFNQIRAEAKITKSRLIEGTLRYVINIAYHYIGQGIPFLDLVQEGVIGLDYAADRFDETKGAHFQQYAGDWIKQRINRYIADVSRVVRIPVHLHEKMIELQRLYVSFLDQRGNPPAELDLFVAMNWLTPADCIDIKQQKQAIQLRKRISMYQKLLEYCTKETDSGRTFSWPTVFESYQQFEKSSGGESSFLKTSSAKGYLTQEDIAHCTELKNMYKWSQHSYLKTNNVPMYLWPTIIKLANTYRGLETTTSEPSSLEVFQAMGWLTEEDIKIVKQSESQQDNLGKIGEIYRKVAGARRQIQHYRMANAIHYSIETTRIKLESIEDSVDSSIADLLPSEALLELTINPIFLGAAIKSVIENLSVRDRYVLVLRFGLEDGQEKTLDQVGQTIEVTRERIRQIAAKALRKLRHPSRGRKLINFVDYNIIIPEVTEEEDTRVYSYMRNHNRHYSGYQWDGIGYRTQLLQALELTELVTESNAEESVFQEKTLVESLIQRYVIGGRRKVWDTRRQGSRAELLREVLEMLGQPTHYDKIHTKALELIPEGLQFSKKVTYTTLFYRADYFRPFGNAVFGLAGWTTYSTETNGEQIFPHCPTPLLSPNSYITSFFESIMVGRELLKRKSLTAGQFWLEMISWAKSNNTSGSDGQNAFDAWYAAGLCEPVDFLNDDETMVKLSIPTDAKLNDVRKHCLNTLCRRVLKMPELLLTIERIARPTLSSIQKVLFGSERIGFDLPTRLEMLAAFEAIQPDGDEWRLTDLGRVILEANPPQELPDFGEIEAFQENAEPAIQVEWDDDLGLLDM